MRSSSRAACGQRSLKRAFSSAQNNHIRTKNARRPEIRRAADSLEAAIKGKPLTDVWFAFPQLKPFESQLVGQTVTHIETRGKALLRTFPIT
jgi:hypothetical protein